MKPGTAREEIRSDFLFQGMRLEILQGDELQRRDVAGGKQHRRSHPRLQRIGPTGHAKAPAVPRLQSGEIILRHRRRKIVALPPAIGQELGGHLHADRMEAVIAGTGAAITVSVKPRHRLQAAGLERLSQDIGAEGFGHVGEATVSRFGVKPPRCRFVNRGLPG